MFISKGLESPKDSMAQEASSSFGAWPRSGTKM